jgi:Tol biopolymer transport system component
LTFDEKDLDGLVWTPNGREIIFSSGREGRIRLWRVSSKGGSPQSLAASGRVLSEPDISPDGRLLAYTEFTSSGWNIARVAISESPDQKASASRLLSSTAGEGFPQFSPDGKRIVFASGRSGSFQIWVCDSDGKSPIQLTNLEAVGGSPHWSPDGKNIVFDARPEGHADLFIISADGGAPRRITTEPTDEIVPTWSHDGRWIYFGSDRSGEMQIWKMPSSGGKAVQVTKDGGFRAFESLAGRWVYYSSQGASPIWKIPVEGGEKSVVLDSVLHWQAWSLEAGGICYVKPTEGGSAEVVLLNLTTMESRKIATADDYRRIRMLSISPDGRWLIYMKGNPLEAEIVLVENFR